MNCLLRLYFCTLLLCFFFSACQNGESVEASQDVNHTAQLKEYRDSSTIAMAAELAAHYQNMDPLQTNYKNSARAEIYLNQAKSLDLNQRIQLTLRGAFELVNAGKNQEALQIYNKLYDEVSKLDFDSKEEYIFNILGMRAITYFRIGELDNCLNNHNSASCILPFKEESYHKLKSGSSNAIKDITQILKIKLDPNFVYLLNVAHMTLGQYPEAVPENMRVPLSMKEAETGIGEFTNVSHLLGVDDNQLSGGVVIEDFTGDGQLDIVATSWDMQDDLVFYINQGDGSYKESHVEAGLKGITGGLNLVKADYNNDGHIDILVLRGAWLPIGKHPNSLLKNNGDGTFTDVTRASGIYSLYPTQTAAWADFNNDGFLDLYIGNESFAGIAPNPCELFLNQKDGTFLNVASSVGAAVAGYIKGVAIGDVDNDGDPDLFLSNLDAKNILLRNDKAETAEGFRFVDISDQAGITEPLQSFPTWFFDYNNDGYEDLFVASYPIKFYGNLAAEYLKDLVGRKSGTETPKLYKNNGDATFSDVTAEVGLDKVCFTMGSSFGDLNNDGYLDIYLGTGEPDLKAVIPNRAFLNMGGERFEEITSQAGLGHVQKGHAISIVDMDNDGDQDIYAVMGGAFEGDIFFNALFENPGNDNNFIKLQLIGSKSNRSGVGAKVQVELASGKSIYRTVGAGSSFGSSPLFLEVGLAEEDNIKLVTIFWPSGEIQKYDALKVRSKYVLKEGSKAAAEIPFTYTKFKLAHAEHHHHH